MPRKGNRLKQLRDANKKRQDDAKAAREAEKAIQEVKPTAAPPDPPPAASSEAKPSSSSSLPHSIEENLVVLTPQLGSGSTGTASSAPGAAAQPKALLGCPNKRGRGKYDHNREQPKPRPNHLLPASRVHFLHGEHPPRVLFCAERACGARCFCNFPAPRAQGPPEQGARNYKEEQQDKTKGRRGTTTKAGAAAQSWELGAEQQEHQLSTQHAARQLGNCACTCACQGPPLKTEPFQSHLAKATRRLSSQF